MNRGVRLLLAATVGALASRESIAEASVPEFDHVFVILMENHAFSSIIGNTTDAPYINGLASRFGVAANYFAVSHPSLPNYLALTGGDTFGITSDCTTCFVNAPNLAVDRVEHSGRTWKAYMESMPSACFAGDSGEYAQKHNPLYYFNDIRTVPSECGKIVPYTGLATDLARASTTPNYAFITPNLCNDMHDSCAPTNNPIRQGDMWLSSQLPNILDSPAFRTQKTVVLVVWDEDDSSGTNQVPALVIGRDVKPGFVSATSYNHYSILKTIEASWGLGSLTTNDASASAMSDFFVTVPAAPAARPWSNAALVLLLAASGVAAGSIERRHRVRRRR